MTRHPLAVFMSHTKRAVSQFESSTAFLYESARRPLRLIDLTAGVFAETAVYNSRL